MKTNLRPGCNPFCRARVGYYMARPQSGVGPHTIHTGDMLLAKTREVKAISRRAALLAQAAREHAHKLTEDRGVCSAWSIPSVYALNIKGLGLESKRDNIPSDLGLVPVLKLAESILRAENEVSQ